ncbi:MAG: LacI family DNA-binding transcriptional regulator [Planctomycetes bacterium]|nr:LacI family DNA-binding transcriptional regulator [Planctomycetota bacterium]
MPFTIRDLAKKLNLSITTVSRALDGYSDVSDKTRERVIHAAQEMGYSPSSAARQLRRRRSDAIGYILPTSSPRFSDPFYANFLAGLCDEAAEHQIDLIVSSSPPDSELEKAMYQRWFQSLRVDGLILNRIRLQDWRINYLSESKVPFVTLGRIPSNQEYPYILVNERGGFERLVTHLAKKGHKRLAYIGASPNLMIQVERFAGYKKGLELSGLSYDEKLVLEGDLTEEGGYYAAQKLLAFSEPPTAILGCNDLTAMGILKAAHESGLQVGKDLAVAGYDGIQETAYTNPPLTTLRQPTYEIARRLAGMLISLTNGNTLNEPRVFFEPDLILRDSTE